MITTKWFLSDKDLEDAYYVRTKVFVEEQGFDAELDKDEVDKTALHLVVYDQNRPIGTGRLYYENGYRIGRVAVLKEFRKNHIGDLIMRMLLLKAFEEEKAEKVIIHAQEGAVGFYEKFGFEKVGQPFFEEHVRHYEMIITPQTLNITPKCAQMANKNI